MSDKLKARHNISVADIVSLILESNYYDVSLLEYDTSCKKILYNKQPFVSLDVEALKFELTFERYTFNYRSFSKALFCLAMMNTQDTMEENTLLEPIQQWLEKNELSSTSTREVISKVFNNSVSGLTYRQLEVRVANTLRELGWQKKRIAKGVIWNKI